MKNHCQLAHKNENMTSITTDTGEILGVPADRSARINLSSFNKNTGSSNGSQNAVIATSSTIASEDSSSLPTGNSTSDSSVTTSTANGQIAIAGQIIKGGTNNSTKVTTTISSLNLGNLVAASGGKIALKALPTGQLFLSQPIDGKMATLVKTDSNNRHDTDDSKNTSLIHLRSDSFPQIELGKLLQFHGKSTSKHQLAVTTSTISVAIPANTLGSLKASQKSFGSSSLVARAVKTPVTGSSANSTPTKETDSGSIGQGVILGVTMEEGTLLDTGDGTLSELTVLD